MWLDYRVFVLRFIFFFFNDTATTEIYTLSLHDALPILFQSLSAFFELVRRPANGARRLWFARGRTVRVDVLEGPPRPMQLDGEPWGDAPFEARLLPAALPVIVDPATAPLGASRRG